ncbi:MAG: NAD(P)-dependent oxidoreductase [Asgard group archaeon]|nr:NAD(P)-dependent oxidoreductase [Asgard group archaeon]
MAKIFITGASGQVGGNLVNFLIKQKELEIENPKDIVCLIRNPAKVTNLKNLGVTIVKGDLEDSDTIKEIMENGITHVFHVAANVDVNATYEELYSPNVLGTRIMLDAFANSQAQCFIYTSSIAVYDDRKMKKRVFKADEETPFGPLDGKPYAVTKRIAENLVQDYVKRYPEKKFAITRLSMVIGKGDRQVVPSMVSALSIRIIPKHVNRGKNEISFTSPIDAARAQIYLANYDGNISGEAYNIARKPVNYREIMKIIADYYDRREPKFSVAFWFFRVILPLLWVLKKIFPKFQLIKTVLSPLTIHYIGRSFIFDNKKLLKLGFKYNVTLEEAVIERLKEFDPKKEMVKPSKRLLRKKKVIK